jgi:arylsulfatase A-like enzyme
VTIRAPALALLVCIAVGGIWWMSTRSGGSTNLVIITLDTTRADRLPAYGLADVSMPNLDRLAREGVVFDQATSVAPLTLPAHASIFTGLYPPAHGVRDNSDPPLSAEHTTLAEILRGYGFRTGAFVGSVVLDADRGLARGFDRYSGVTSGTLTGPERQRRADEVVADALRWLDEIGDSKFFLWAHLYDPHLPYDPPEPYRSAYFDQYIGEIVFADSQIGRLLDALDRKHLTQQTVVVVVGDHGESLGDHGEKDHGRTVYEGVLRVPLIVRAPRILPRRVDGIVRQVDLLPTVLDLMGESLPARSDGVSLVSLMKGGRSLGLDAYSESLYPRRWGGRAVRALRQGSFKLIDSPAPELYNLDRDPFEEHDIYAVDRTVADRLSRGLSTLAQSHAWGPFERYQPAPVPAELKERLGSLGYVAGR